MGQRSEANSFPFREVKGLAQGHPVKKVWASLPFPSLLSWPGVQL